MTQPHSHQWMIHIRSKECALQANSGGLNTALSVDLKTHIERIPGHEFEISLSSAEIPFVWYNVSSNLQSREIRVNPSPVLPVLGLNLAEGN